MCVCVCVCVCVCSNGVSIGLIKNFVQSVTLVRLLYVHMSLCNETTCFNVFSLDVEGVHYKLSIICSFRGFFSLCYFQRVAF